MEAMEYLDLMEDEPTDVGMVKPAWEVDNDSNADWALRKILEARADRDRRVEHYKRQIAHEEEACSRVESFFGEHLQRYFATLPVRETKTQKSYSLPSGKLVLKRRQPEYKRENDTLCAWLIGMGLSDCVEHIDTYKALWANLKPLTESRDDGSVVYAESGEIIPGLAAVPQEDVFTIGG
jgi:Bacteriophage Mu Gam like protein.